MFVFVESLRMAWVSILGNKLRSLLTALGVIIGVAAVIALVSVGQGAQKSTEAQITALGTNLITVRPQGNGFRIVEEDLTIIQQRFAGIEAVLPSVGGTQYVKAEGGDSLQVTIEGTGVAYSQVRDRNVALGGFFTQEDLDRRSRVAVIGTTTAQNLFGNGNSIGKQFRLLGQPFTVIGLLEPKGTGVTGQDQDDMILVPYTTVSRLQGINRIPSLTVKAKSAEESKLLTQELTDYFVAKFRNDENAVRVQSQDQLLQTVGSITQTFTMLLGAIASISLAVGGIGIMNIMLVSVSERTREIGIRKAIGAKSRDVLLQFLIEALILSGAGGIIGILIGGSGALALSKVLAFPPAITASAVMLSFGFSVAIGIIFGFYPAYRAANLDPIEALRRD
ncbi:MAG TPA: ABC transporter permease [Symbiobacteriaceae bacterium]|nr:ABC transporter permease [Symbiobacteriaceae bacterium]